MRHAGTLCKDVPWHEALTAVARDLPEKAAPGDIHATLLRADTVEEEKVGFVWAPYLPRKMATILDGDPGVGKTGLACLLAACVSQGWGMPDQAGRPPGLQHDPAEVLMVAMEDT